MPCPGLTDIPLLDCCGPPGCNHLLVISAMTGISDRLNTAGHLYGRARQSGFVEAQDAAGVVVCHEDFETVWEIAHKTGAVTRTDTNFQAAVSCFGQVALFQGCGDVSSGAIERKLCNAQRALGQPIYTCIDNQITVEDERDLPTWISQMQNLLLEASFSPGRAFPTSPPTSPPGSTYRVLELNAGTGESGDVTLQQQIPPDPPCIARARVANVLLGGVGDAVGAAESGVSLDTVKANADLQKGLWPRDPQDCCVRRWEHFLGTTPEAAGNIDQECLPLRAENASIIFCPPFTPGHVPRWFAPILLRPDCPTVTGPFWMVQSWVNSTGARTVRSGLPKFYSGGTGYPTPSFPDICCLPAPNPAP